MSRGVLPGVSSVVAVAPTLGGFAVSVALASIDYDARSSLVFQKKAQKRSHIPGTVREAKSSTHCGCWFCSPFLGPFSGPRFLASVS